MNINYKTTDFESKLNSIIGETESYSETDNGTIIDEIIKNASKIDIADLSIDDVNALRDINDTLRNLPSKSKQDQETEFRSQYKSPAIHKKGYKRSSINRDSGKIKVNRVMKPNPEYNIRRDAHMFKQRQGLPNIQGG